MKGLVFEKKTHTYRYKGELVAGVTSVLESAGLSDFSMVKKEHLEYAQQLGTAVHLAIEYNNKGLKFETEGIVQRYIDLWIKFKDHFQIEPIENELMVFSKKFMYAGTLDLLAKSPKIDGGKPFILDYKTGGESLAHRVQMAAYEYAVKQDKRTSMSRFTLYLSENKYRLSEAYKDRKDFDVFLGALSVHNYRKGNK